MTVVCAFALSVIAGSSLCRATLRGSWRDLPWALRLGLGWTAGGAFSGMATFWATVLTPQHRGLFVGVAMGLVLCLLAVRTSPKQVEEAPPRRRDRIFSQVTAVAFWVVLALWLSHILDIAAGAPAGGWDAWSIWTHHARFLYLTPEGWQHLADPDIWWSHSEYPLLVPSLIAYGWLPAGHVVAASPVAIALLTQVGMLLLLVGFTQAAYSRSGWPWMFGIFYATIPLEWSQEEAWQYADRPLALLLLAAGGSVALAIRQKHWSWFLLAGLFWGAGAFTKDEGKAALLVLAVGALFGTICSLSHKGGWRPIGNLGLLVVGLTPGVASVLVQRQFAPVPSRLLSLMTIAPLADFSRTEIIAHFVLDRWNSARTGGLWWVCFAALIAFGPRIRRRDLWVLWLLPITQLFIYVLIFQLTPEDLHWHLDTAMPRLLFHVGPSMFLAASWLIVEAKCHLVDGASAEARGESGGGKVPAVRPL